MVVCRFCRKEVFELTFYSSKRPPEGRFIHRWAMDAEVCRVNHSVMIPLPLDEEFIVTKVLEKYSYVEIGPVFE